MNIIKMIDKFNNSPKGRLISSFFVLGFSIIMVVTAVYAWFANNTRTNSTGMGVVADIEDAFVIYTPYYISDIDTQTVSMGTQVDARFTKNLNIDLLPYDLTFTSVNVYTPVVLRVLIGNMDSKYVPTGNETKHLNIVISRNTALDNGTTSTLAGIFSSVGQVGCYKSTAYATSNVAPKTIYDGIMPRYRADNSQSKFTTITNDVISKVDTLSIDVEYSASDFMVDAYSVNYLPIYLVLDYNGTLAQRYATQNSGGGLGSISQRYIISNDLTTIKVDFPNA